MKTSKRIIALAATTTLLASMACMGNIPASAATVTSATVRTQATPDENPAVQKFIESVEEKLTADDYVGALALCDQAIASDSKDAVAYYYRALVQYMQRKNINIVLEDLNKAVECNPQYVMALMGRAFVLEQLNEFAAAIKDYDAVLAIEPQNMDAIYGRISLHGSLKDWQGLVDDYTLVITIEPENVEAFYYRAVAYSKLNKKDEAIADLKKLNEMLIAQNRQEEAAWVQGLIASVEAGQSIG